MKSHSEQLDELQKLRQQISNEQKLLKAQQEYLERVPLETKIAAAHLTKLHADKTLIDNEIAKYSRKIVTIKLDHIAVMVELKDQKEMIEKDINKKTKLLATFDKPIADASTKLQAIKDESGTRKRYLIEQENIITHMMEDANDSINNAHSTYGQLERSIKGLENEKLQLQDEIQDLTLDKNSIENDTLLIQQNNEEAHLQASKKLSETLSLIEEQKAQRTLIIDDIDARKGELRAEVESIDAKRAALYKENEELQVAKRRFTSSKDLYAL